MKIEVNEHGTIVLKEVFNPIKLVTADNETLIITMRDSGFEVCYENDFYELKQGKVLADSASFWMNADKSTVQNFLKESVEDMDEYNRKKKEIKKQCFEQAEQRFEKPNGVSNNFFIWTMIVMAILGLIAAWLKL